MARYCITYAQNFKYIFKIRGCAVLLGTVFLFILCGHNRCSAQEQDYYVQSVKITGNNLYSTKALLEHMDIPLPVSIKAAEITKSLQNLIALYRDSGYYFARIDTVYLVRNARNGYCTLTVGLHESRKFVFGAVTVTGSAAEDIQTMQSYFPVRGSLFTIHKFEYALGQAIEYFEDHGFPYSTIKIRSIDYTDGSDYQALQVNIVLDVDRDKYVTIDTVAVEGSEYTRTGVIIRESRLRTGGAFSQDALKKARDYVRKLSYIENADEPLLYELIDGKSLIQLTVKERRANRFNGIIGYIPSRASEKGYSIGSFDINFGSLFGTGRKFQASWHKLDRTSQILKTYYEEPWIAGLPVNVSGSFEQSIQDSSFIKRRFTMGVYFRVNSAITAHLSLGGEQVIAEETGRNVFNERNSRSTFYSAGVSYDKMDYRMNPRKGVYYATSVTQQSRKITEKGYAQERRNELDRKINAEVEVAFPVRNPLILFVKAVWNQTSSSAGEIPVSQQWYLGGAASIRGYREKQFLAATAAWYNLEFRYLLNRNSRLFLFQDGGFYQNKSGPLNRKFGYGFGIRVDSRIGLIGFDFGIGEGDTFSTSKLHVIIQNTF